MQTVLVVEDNSVVRESYNRALKQAGFNVLLDEDGKQGLLTAASVIPDVIVTGILMPGINGFQLIEELKASNDTKHIPIIVVSALSGAADKQQALKLGAVSFLAKDETYPRDIVHAVSNVLNSTPRSSPKVQNPDYLEPLKYLFGGLVILALVATLSIDSFDFYMFVRWAMFTGFIASIWLLKEDDERSWMIVLSLIGAFIFNPFSIITNSKDWWVIVDLITACYFGYLAYLANEEKS